MHALGEFLSWIGKNYTENSSVWRVSVAVLGALLCVVGGQAILQSVTADPGVPGHLDVGLYVYGDFDLPRMLWPTLCVASVAGALVLLARGFGARLGYHWIMLAIGVVLASGAIHSDIVQGQTNTIVLLLLVAGLLLRSQNRIVAASLAFAVMISLQPLMFAVLIYFVLRGDWRTARWGLGMGAAVFLASYLPTWSNAIEAGLGGVINGADNQSAYGLLLRMFADTPVLTPWVHDPAVVAAFMALVLTLAGVVAVVGLHLDRDEDADQDMRLGPAPAVLLLECSLIVALAMACVPLTGASLLIIAFAGLAGALIVGLERIGTKSKHARLWIVTILAWALLALLAAFPGAPLASSDIKGWEILARGGSALLLACTATAIALWQERRAAAEVVIPKRPFGKRRSIAQPALDAAHPG